MKRALETRELAAAPSPALARVQVQRRCSRSVHRAATAHPLTAESQRLRKARLCQRDDGRALRPWHARQRRPSCRSSSKARPEPARSCWRARIHYNCAADGRARCMVQNCGGMPDELLQSELFGHKRGAYTGAITDRLGLFRAADGGTVFLDEISEVSPSFQVSLLRFLQEGEVKPLGSDKTRPAMCASSRVELLAARTLRRPGKFRQDLYFRLKRLRARQCRLARAARRHSGTRRVLRRQAARAMRRARSLGISAERVERAHGATSFPGNVRELENEIRRMVALAKDGELSDHRASCPRPSLAAMPRKPRPDQTARAGRQDAEGQGRGARKAARRRGSRCGIVGTRATRPTSLGCHASASPTRSSVTPSSPRPEEAEMPNSDETDDGAAVVAFPFSRVRPKGPLVRPRSSASESWRRRSAYRREQLSGHWCSRCKGIWFGYLLEVECPACGNRNG